MIIDPVTKALQQRVDELEKRVATLEGTGKELVKPEKPKAKRGSRLPESWVPKTETIEAICTELGVTQEPLVQEHRRFCDYWYGVAGQRGVKLDWDATWRNWMRKAYEQGNLGGLTRTSTEKKMNGYVDRSARLAQQARDAVDRAARLAQPARDAVEIEDARSQS